MKKSVIKKYFIALVICFFSASLWASAESDFELGVQSFKSGDNEAAITYFESAMQQGMDSVSLHYNLASSYYKVGRYSDSKKYFKIVYQTVAMRDLAEYNLGLIAIQEKEWSLARQYFSSIASSGKDEKLITLSKKQLVTLTKKEDRSKVYLSSNYGYDNNISSANNDSVVNQSDTFYDLFAAVDFLISGKRTDGWIADAYLYRIDYSDIDTTDENHYALGLKRSIKIDDWDTSARLSMSKRTFGGKDYQHSAMLDFQGNKKLSTSDGLYLRYRYEDITSEQPIYDYLEGSRQQIRLEYRNYNHQAIKQIYYELELNNRGELVTSNYRYDYSPTRHTIRGKYTYYLNDKWQLGGDLSYRFSDYPSSSTIDREDEQWKIALSADYHFDRTFKMTTSLQYTDNTSTEDRYDYDKSVIRIGLSKSF